MIGKKNKNKQNRVEYELIYGAHSIIELLKAKKRKLYSIYTTKPLPNSWYRVEKYIPKNVNNIQYVSKDILNKMAGCTDHMGIIALVSPFVFAKQIFNPENKKFILLLDSIQDVRNLGAILRSAYCTGVDGVVLCQKGGASVTAASHKASAGLVEYLDVYLAPSIGFAVNELKKVGYNFYMAVLENGQNANVVNYKEPACLVIGNEAIGISKNIQNEGVLITLPQKRADISYNASVAAGILLFLISQALKKS